MDLRRSLPADAAPNYDIACFPARVDGLFIDGERVSAQAGDFHGGWISAGIEGPIQGGAGI